MRKDPSWFIGAGGLLCLAISGSALYLSRHPEVANRFTPAVKPQASEAQAAEEIADDNPGEPVHFLSEQAIAQEYHRQADLPFNIAPAGTKKSEEDEDSPLPGQTPKNRLPGKIVFQEETQEASEFDSLFNTRDDSDDVKPLNKPAVTDENDPRVMNYCMEDGEEKGEMPYAENGFEVKKPSWNSDRTRLLFPDSKDEQVWDDISNGKYDVEGPGNKEQSDSDDDDDGVRDFFEFIGNHSLFINFALGRIGFPLSFFTIEACADSFIIQTPLTKLLSELCFQSENQATKPATPTSEESGPQNMSYCVEEGDTSAVMLYASEEELSNEWSMFLKVGSEEDSDSYSSIPLSQDDVETIISQQSEETKKHLVLFEGTINAEGTVIGEVRPYFETGYFNLPEQLPWINFSSHPIQNPCESIDTIWPLNLLGRPFRGLISYLVDPNRRMTEMHGWSDDFESRKEEDKPGRISPERVHGGIQ